MAAGDSKSSVEGKYVLVTGGNTGIGKATVESLANSGAHVFLACRNVDKGEAAKSEIGDVKGSIEVVKIDLGSLEAVKKDAEAFLAKHDTLHVLIENAGVMFIDSMPKSTTADGLEQQFGVNHVAHVLLETILRPALVKGGEKGGEDGGKGDPARVLILSSGAHRWAEVDVDDLNWETREFVGSKAYGCSKMYNIVHARYLAKLYEEEDLPIVSASIHPGIVKTELARDWPITQGVMGFFVGGLVSLFARTPLQGAGTTIHLTTDNSIIENNGGYYTDNAPAEVQVDLSDDVQKAIMDKTFETIKVILEKERE